MALLKMPGVSDTVSVDLANQVATVTLDRPAVLNAIDREQRQNLEMVFRALEVHDQVRVVVLQGAGTSFSSGQDQKESATMDAHAAAGRVEDYVRMFTALRALGKPVIARLYGYANGTGLHLAFLADLRIAAATAKLGMTDLAVGSTAILASAILRSLVGEAVMRRLVLYSDFVTAAEALSMGLVHEVHSEDGIDARVAELAADLATRPPLAVTLTKQWWRRMGDAMFDAAVDQARVADARNFESGDLSAGAAAFLPRS